MSGGRGPETPGCDSVRRRLTLHFYGHAEEPEALQRHLDACASCAELWAGVVRDLGAVDAAAVFPRERDVDWTEFARRTVERAEAAERDSRQARSARLPARAAGSRTLLWGGVLAAAAALVVLAGLRTRQAAPAPPLAVAHGTGTAGEGPDETRFLQESVTRQAAARSLRDGRALLVDLMQAPVRCRRTDGSYDVALEKARANELLRRVSLYQGSLAGPGDRRLSELLGQLESMLLQVSSMDDCTAVQAIHDLRAAIERRQILLRIDLVTREVEEAGTRA
jgi:hypothetical protein